METGPDRAGSAVHQRGREDSRRHGRRRLHEPGVASIMVQHFLVKGRVQGVGFRWFVQREAAEIGLRGWVRNTDDGRRGSGGRGRCRTS